MNQMFSDFMFPPQGVEERLPEAAVRFPRKQCGNSAPVYLWAAVWIFLCGCHLTN